MKKYLLGIALLVFAVSCEETPEEPVKKPIEWNQEKSTAFNKEAALEEDIDIKIYLAQHTEYTVESTGSGLRYIPIRKTEGEMAKAGQDAKVQYKVTLLDGKECYKTAKDELDVFRIDKSNIETGIQEGIKKMRIGERSKLIIPSHLAHGLIGDMDKIPPLTPIIVDIELIELN
jgi:FKBP-type peptidyl-prolyl cis-trans isomerase